MAVRDNRAAAEEEGMTDEEPRCGATIRMMERGGGGAPAACGSTAAGRIQ